MTYMHRDPFLPFGWPSTIKECNGYENCNSLYRSILRCLGPEGLEQLKTSRLSLGLLQRCADVLQNAINSRSDMRDLAMDFVVAISYIDNVLAEPLDIYTATRRLLSGIKTILGYVEKTRESGDRKSEEFVLDVLIAAVYGVVSNYLSEKKGDLLIRMKLAELANALATLASPPLPTVTSTSTTQSATPDWW